MAEPSAPDVGTDVTRSDGTDGAQAAPASARAPRERGFDSSAFRVRHVALYVMYIGDAYHGLADAIGASQRPQLARQSDDTRSRKRARTAACDARVDAAAAPQGETSAPSTAAPAAAQVQTIESEMFSALLRACLITSRSGAGYTRCGRTDRGVSSAGQVLALRLRSKARRGVSVSDSAAPSTSVAVTGDTAAPGPAWVREDAPDNDGEPFPPPDKELDYATILNALLPRDIRVVGWSDVSDAFSARFSATSRLYRYYFVRRRGVDLAAMADAGARLVGKHDFRNFCKFRMDNVSNFVREVLSFRIVRAAGNVHVCAHTHTHASATAAAAEAAAEHVCEGIHPADIPENEVMYVELSGRAFLWHQVRCLMSVLFTIAHGHEAPDVVDAMLDVARTPGRPAYKMADDAPLVLYHCGFGEPGSAAGIGGLSRDEDEDELAAFAPDADATLAAWHRPAQFALQDETLYARMHHSPSGLRSATLALEEQWRELAIKAARVRGMLDKLYALSVPNACAPDKRPWRDVSTEGMGSFRPLDLAEQQYPAKSSNKYKPLLQRAAAPSVAARWTALSDDQRAALARSHPINAARFARAAATDTARGNAETSVSGDAEE